MLNIMSANLNLFDPVNIIGSDVLNREEIKNTETARIPETKISEPSLVYSKKHKFSVRKISTVTENVQELDLYEDDTAATNMPHLSTYLKSLAGIDEKEKENAQASSGHGSGKSKLGVLFGVYLPSIQHILGVQMFLRLLWIVGISGLVESFTMVFICCLCTFLTSISISAIATNGVIESGGGYFMISRNLGPEFGGAIGILYYLANTVATAMYLVGGVEILLVYMAPGLPQFGDPHHGHVEELDMFNNFRLYASGFLLILFVVCVFGVKFVQFFAPISLACVFLSILAVFVGAFAASPDNSPMLCMLGDVLLKMRTIKDANGTIQCNKTESSPIWKHYCRYNDTNKPYCDPYFLDNDVYLTPGIPGFFHGTMKENAWPTYMTNGESFPTRSNGPDIEVKQDITTTFFVLLAIFFPSVTGIMTGANMSGDLADPQKSIPVGTIAAQLTTSFIYLIFVVFYAGTIKGALLRDKYGESLDNMMVVAKLSWPNDWVLLVGSFTSCLGAGLQCLCTAPRLLQSIAKDDLIPFLSPFSHLTKRNEPFKALLITTLITECAILIGGIDYIAPVVDFFFLMSYCFVNLACALQTLLKVPNWRPRFKFYHWTLAVAGALLNLFIMFSTHWYYAIIVIILCGLLYKYIEYKGAKKEWGDGMRGLALTTAQFSLLRVEDNQVHPKNWRPQLLVLLKLKDSEDFNNQKMLQLTNQMKASRGLTVVATLVKGDLSIPEDRQAVALAKEKLRHSMKDAKIKGFIEVAACHNISENVSTFIQSIGLGGLRPNTVMIGWPNDWKSEAIKRTDKYANFLDAVERATTGDMCLVVPKGLQFFPDNNDQLNGNIDVWWIIHDGGLLILLPFLLRQHKVWKNCLLRIFAVASTDDNTIKMKENLENWVYQLRIEAEVIIIELSDTTIAPYTYERTLMMEERAKLAMTLSQKELLHEPQLLTDRNRTGAAELSTTPQMVRKKSSISQLAGKLFSMNNADEATSQPMRKSSKDQSSMRKHSSAVKIETMPTVDEDEKPAEQGRVNEAFEPNPDRLRVSFALPNNSSFVDDITADEANDDSQQQRDNKDSVYRFVTLDKKRLRKMNNAVQLNKAIREKSTASKLVVLNLPKPPKSAVAMSRYMEYLEVLTDSIQRVLLVRGSGKEVITIYS